MDTNFNCRRWAIAHPPVIPLLERDGWADALRGVSSRPLAFMPNFAEAALRHEAWWRHECVGRPLVLGSANLHPARPITRRLDLLGHPDAWLDAKVEDVRQTHRVGDTLPTVRVDLGPVSLGAMLGAEVGVGSDTVWTHAFIDDEWSNAPSWRIDNDNGWWRAMRGLTDRAAREAPGRFLVCTPDLGGSGDVLLNLRGASPLCMDAVACPERLVQAVDALYAVWHKAFSELYRIAVGIHGAGLVHWLTLWSEQPYVVPACDFNFLIGPSEFEALFLPDIARQCATVGRAVFHLDGSGAARHIDALLEVPDLNIQFTPGAGTPSALAWVDMFGKIQARGRSLLVFCPVEEALDLCKVLRPEGLAIHLDGSASPATLDAVFEAICRRFPDSA